MVGAVGVELRLILNAWEVVQIMLRSQQTHEQVRLIVAAVVLPEVAPREDDALLDAAHGGLGRTDVDDAGRLQTHRVRGKYALLMQQHRLEPEMLEQHADEAAGLHLVEAIRQHENAVEMLQILPWYFKVHLN